MARIGHVKSFQGQRKCQKRISTFTKCLRSRKSHNEIDHDFETAPKTCNFCHKPIEVGMAYKFVSLNRFSPTMNRHEECPGWKQSELVSNEKVSALMATEEDSEEQLVVINFPTTIVEAKETFDKFVEIRDNLEEQIQEVVAMYEESADNIEDGFGHETSQSDELRECAYEVDSFANDVACIEIEEPEDFVSGLMDIHQTPDDLIDADDISEEIEDHLEAWSEEQIESFRDTFSAMPLF